MKYYINDVLITPGNRSLKFSIDWNNIVSFPAEFTQSRQVHQHDTGVDT